MEKRGFRSKNDLAGKGYVSKKNNEKHGVPKTLKTLK